MHTASSPLHCHSLPLSPSFLFSSRPFSHFFLPSPSPSLFLPFALQLFLSFPPLLSPPIPSPTPLPSPTSSPPLPLRGLVLIRGKSSDGTGADSNGSGKVLHSVLACDSPFSNSSIVLSTPYSQSIVRYVHA